MALIVVMASKRPLQVSRRSPGEIRGDQIMLTRRACLVGAAAAALPVSITTAAESIDDFDVTSPLPHKSAFFPIAGTYLNSASQHPLSRGARRAVNRYLDYKTFSGDSDFSNSDVRQRIIDNFARLIGAASDEICFVQSTTVGENLILQALDIPLRPGRVVTDELHFVGSLPTYSELARHGMDVVTVRASADGSIDMDRFEAAITGDTRLVAISLVSTINGYRHDLKRLCEIAHAKGAYVYADIIHAVGTMPLDVHESGVDFCSTASYKWLMGDMGLGFMYVHRDRLAEIRRPWFDHNQLASMRSVGFPNPEPLDHVTEYEHLDSALGHFAMGTQANIVASQLDYSLDYLLKVGVERIQAYRQPLTDRLQNALPKLGYAAITPRDSHTALASFRHDGDAEALSRRLHAEGIVISVWPYHFRISPSVFNDMEDIERLIDVLS
jgi:selenocysteine lyase/cysteine desulfurase